MSIGADDLRLKVAEFFSQTDKPEGERIAALYGYIAENYAQLSPEAVALVDKLNDVLKSGFREALRRAPDVPEVHRLKRMFARLTGEHWDAVGLIGALESKTILQHPIVQGARPLFEKHLQTYLDLLWDVAQHTHSGPAAATRISMFALCADEMLAAFHLAQRGYASQAFAHQRTVLEALELIELFTQTPEAADEWVGTDQDAAWKKFRPSMVRRAHAQHPRDPFYSFLSAYGAHVTWRTVQIRTGVIKSPKDQGNPEIILFVGGTRFVSNLVHANILCFYLLYSGIIKLVSALGDFIDPGLALAAMQEAGMEILQFVLDQYVAWARKQGLDVDEMEQFIKDQMTSIQKDLPPPREARES